MFSCPKCRRVMLNEGKDYAPVESTHVNARGAVVRTRRCNFCSHRFKTTEVPTTHLNRMEQRSGLFYQFRVKVRELAKLAESHED